ncbi:hypothetical protein RHS04_08084 [Rhizoctonia solani]|uniref:Uncharacterized protein n=1 Tax=Rhizoctonia solani TaxID=456999 RepID=A0A8H7H1V8_9AGAM|nr:hypothetical protein RHS04_08084 [Rhizoctonia solani]
MIPSPLLQTQVRNTVTPARDRHLVATSSPRSPCSPRPPAPSLRPVAFMRFSRTSTLSLRYPRIPRGRCAHSHNIGPDLAKLRLGPSVLTIGCAEPLGSPLLIFAYLFHFVLYFTSLFLSCFALRTHGHFLPAPAASLHVFTYVYKQAWEVQCLPSLATPVLTRRIHLLILLARPAPSRRLDTCPHRPLRSALTRLVIRFASASLTPPVQQAHRISKTL